MVNLKVSLMDLTIETGILGNMMCLFPSHGGLLVDMVNKSIKEESNTTCGEDTNTACDEDSNTTCDEDSNTTCDEDSYITCEEI